MPEQSMQAQDSEWLFSKAEPGKYDLILMDIMMPVMGGWEATRQIRGFNREDAKNIPIIAMTANAFLDDIEHSKEVGMNDHIIKPLDMDELIAKIVRAITI